MAWSPLIGLRLQVVKNFLNKDTNLHELYDKCVNAYLHDSNYYAKNDLLIWKDRLVIPSNDQLEHNFFINFMLVKFGVIHEFQKLLLG